jgi:hypothetical protein
MAGIARRIAVVALLLSNTAAVAGDARQTHAIEKDAIATVRANSIWFEDAAGLSRWQESKKSMGAEAFEGYQHQLLGNREAWQFTLPLTVKILGSDADHNQTRVELQTPGRLMGTEWHLDAAAIEP